MGGREGGSHSPSLPCFDQTRPGPCVAWRRCQGDAVQGRAAFAGWGGGEGVGLGVAGPAPYRQVAGVAWTRDHLVGNLDTFVDTIFHSPSVPKGIGLITIPWNSSAAFATICPEPSAHSQRATETRTTGDGDHRNNSRCKCSGRISGAQSLVFQCVDPKITPKRLQSLRLYREVGVSLKCHGTKILERDTQNLYGFEISMKAPLIFLRCSIDQFSGPDFMLHCFFIARIVPKCLRKVHRLIVKSLMPGEELSPIALIRLEKVTLFCSFSGRLHKNICIAALHCSTCWGPIANGQTKISNWSTSCGP
jgi:hypothetical protein